MVFIQSRAGAGKENGFTTEAQRARRGVFRFLIGTRMFFSVSFVTLW
jgi:hypothetical protein